MLLIRIYFSNVNAGGITNFNSIPLSVDKIATSKLVTIEDLVKHRFIFELLQTQIRELLTNKHIQQQDQAGDHPGDDSHHPSGFPKKTPLD